MIESTGCIEEEQSISAEIDAGNDARVKELTNARACWERGQHTAATRHVRASAE